MALSVFQSVLLPVVAGDATIIPGLVGRKVLILQNFQHKDMWIGFDKNPTEEGGLLLRKGRSVDVATGGGGGGDNTNFFEGAIHVMQFSSRTLTVFVHEML